MIPYYPTTRLNFYYYYRLASLNPTTSKPLESYYYGLAILHRATLKSEEM